MVAGTMGRGTKRLALAVLLAGPLSAQQQVWQVLGPPPTTPDQIMMAPFGDYDHDGVKDFLQVEIPNYPSLDLMVQIRSGVSGAVLWQRLEYTRNVAYAGDVNGDGFPDFALLGACCTAFPLSVQVWSPATNQLLWQAGGSFSSLYGDLMLGDIDVQGDGFSDLLIAQTHPSSPALYLHDHVGNLIYQFPLAAMNWHLTSLAKMGDMDGDGGDDFLMGCSESSGRGVLVLVSGRTGTVLRTTYGLQPGDRLHHLATNLGDITGDGVNDFAAFAWWSAQRSICVAFSGATGAPLRQWLLSTDSVVGGHDLDLDGVPDLVVAGAFPVAGTQVYGITYAFSGRDGAELWRVENFPGSGIFGTQWGRYAAGFGVLPGSPYPAVGWMDPLFYQPPNTGHGRVRAFRGTRAGQGPVKGTPCSSTGVLPLIGVRETSTGARVTIAKGPPGGMAWFALAFGNPTTLSGMPLPVALDAFGWIGCHAYVTPDIGDFRLLGTNGIDRGYAHVDLGARCAPALGLVVSAQWLALDPATMGYAATQKHQLRLF
jgi:hypothetical protein